MSWGYAAENGPSTWSSNYAEAGGKSQSPIDINTINAVYDENLANFPIEINYNDDCFTTLKNSGHSFTVSGSDKAVSNVVGGPVSQNHTFLQFHMHWGENDSVGSEHTVNGESYQAELHFVNWNSQAYTSPSDAVKSNKHDGLIVLGVFVKIGNQNLEFDKIVNSLSRIQFSGQSVDLTDAINYRQLFPDDLSKFYTYNGSLTTPPCYECVQWVVFKDPIEISSEQLNAFRNLYQSSDSTDPCDSHKMVQNFRPVCDLNDRSVRKSFNDYLSNF